MLLLATIPNYLFHLFTFILILISAYIQMQLYRYIISLIVRKMYYVSIWNKKILNNLY